jgi:anti-sigma factor RsiW
MMPECREVRERMVDHAYGELPADQAAHLDAHLDTCHGCREEWERLRRDLARLDAWTAPLPPGGLRERVLAGLARRRAEAAERHLAALRPERVVAATLSGALMAGISLLLVSGAGQGDLSPVGFGFVSAVWATLYAGALVLVGSRPFGAAARAALTGAGIAMILAAPLAIPRVVEVCARLVQAAPGAVVFGVVVMVVAVGYTVAARLRWWSRRRIGGYC